MRGWADMQMSGYADVQIWRGGCFSYFKNFSFSTFVGSSDNLLVCTSMIWLRMINILRGIIDRTTRTNPINSSVFLIWITSQDRDAQKKEKRRRERARAHYENKIWRPKGDPHCCIGWCGRAVVPLSYSVSRKCFESLKYTLDLFFGWRLGHENIRAGDEEMRRERLTVWSAFECYWRRFE